MLPAGPQGGRQSKPRRPVSQEEPRRRGILGRERVACSLLAGARVRGCVFAMRWRRTELLAPQTSKSPYVPFE